jgi:hypothetical protein
MRKCKDGSLCHLQVPDPPVWHDIHKVYLGFSNFPFLVKFFYPWININHSYTNENCEVLGSEGCDIKIGTNKWIVITVIIIIRTTWFFSVWLQAIISHSLSLAVCEVT